MEADIDKLQIEIKANSAEAESAIDRLTSSLQRLQTTVGNNPALKQTAQQVKNIGKATGRPGRRRASCPAAAA